MTLTDPAEFDKYAAKYEQLHRINIAMSGEQPEYFAHYKVADVRRIWSRRCKTAEPGSILDFGGGVGSSARFFRRYFPRSSLTIADVSQKSLAAACARRVEGLQCLIFDGVNLPLADGRVDLIFAAGVFHHIPEHRHIPLMREIGRVLRPGGLFFVFEHNPSNPLTVRAVNTCPFDENAVLIPPREMRTRMKEAGFDTSRIQFRIFVPGQLRALRFVERGLTWLPLGAQYLVFGTR